MNTCIVCQVQILLLDNKKRMSSLHQADVSESESDQSRLSASGSFHSFHPNPPYAAHSDSSASRPCAFLEKERDRLVRDHDLHLREIRRLNVKIEELETKESGIAVPSSTGGAEKCTESWCAADACRASCYLVWGVLRGIQMHCMHTAGT